MKPLTIKRIAFTETGTFGVILDGFIPFALTGELPWLDYKKGVSCIPLGTYTCKLVSTPIHGKVFQVLNVKGRDSILFHTGNIPLADSKGCILIGEEFGIMNGVPAVLSSKRGYAEFLNRLAGAAEFKLIIFNC